jgi:hypothetical protein
MVGVWEERERRGVPFVTSANCPSSAKLKWGALRAHVPRPEACSLRKRPEPPFWTLRSVEEYERKREGYVGVKL